MFEIVALLLAVFAIAVVIMPLSKRQITQDAVSDVSFFRTQLQQIDEQLGSTDENTATLKEERVEVAKRLLKADRDANMLASARPYGHKAKTAIAVSTIFGIPIFAFALYFGLGAPGTVDAPLNKMAAKELKTLPVQQLLARAEAQLEKNPNDLRGWQVVERVYAKMQRKSDQKRALTQIIRIDGENADRLSGLAELQLEENDGVISASTRTLLERALALNPDHIRANYYMSYAEEQEGNVALAVARISRLVPFAEVGSQLEPVLKDRLAQLQLKNGGINSGPSAEDIENASRLNDKDRREFIEGMVDRLADKTRENPQNKENWPKLLNAYIVLGNFDKAEQVLKRAKAQFDDDEQMQSVLTDFEIKLKQQKAAQ